MLPVFLPPKRQAHFVLIHKETVCCWGSVGLAGRRPLADCRGAAQHCTPACLPHQRPHLATRSATPWAAAAGLARLPLPASAADGAGGQCGRAHALPGAARVLHLHGTRSVLQVGGCGSLVTRFSLQLVAAVAACRPRGGAPLQPSLRGAAPPAALPHPPPHRTAPGCSHYLINPAHMLRDNAARLYGALNETSWGAHAKVVVMTPLGLGSPRFARQVMTAVNPALSMETWSEFSSRLPSQPVRGGAAWVQRLAGWGRQGQLCGCRDASAVSPSLLHLLPPAASRSPPPAPLPAVPCRPPEASATFRPRCCRRRRRAQRTAWRARRSAASATCMCAWKT